MSSFDITSLFTNIPIDESIDIILDQLFSSPQLFQGFSPEQLKQLLNLSVKNCHLTFRGRVFDQIEGVAMGSPLSPLFANIFLSYHEQNWLKNCPGQFKPIYYRCYVDDCSILVKSKYYITPFLDYLNSQHTCIHFTCEIEADKTLPFLDIKIQCSNGSFVTSVYRKPTLKVLYP